VVPESKLFRTAVLALLLEARCTSYNPTNSVKY